MISHRTVHLSCIFGIALAMFGLSGQRATGADHSTIERGLPLRIESAYPLSFRGRELQLSTQYALTDDSEDQLRLEPRVEIGVLPNTELKIGAPFLLGEADDRGSGDLQIEGLYNFNQETISLPAMSVSLALDVPSGRRSEGVDTTLSMLFTKTLNTGHRTEGFDQVHLNLSWTHNFQSLDDERSDAFEIVAGYSRRLTPDLMLVADIVRTWELERATESTLIEGGFRYQFDPLTVLSGGVGFGIGDESPDVLVTVGLQRSF